MRADTPSQLHMLGVEDVRETNELRLLHVIRDRQPISRADLVKATGLRAGTVSVIVNRLIRNSVVHEGDEAPSSGGRRATYLQVNSEKAYVIGISIGVEQTQFGVSDFNGRIFGQYTLPTEGDAVQFLKHLSRTISEHVKSHFPRAKVSGVGVSIPGLIDRMQGHVVRSPNLGWSDVPVRILLEKEIGLPVSIENDANAAAFSELWYGPMELWSTHCMLFVLVVEGIGTGLILNGEVYGGTRIGLGGFGHIPMDPNGPVCTCGTVGCWEAMASDRATLARFAKNCSGGETARSVRELIALAESGNHCARAELLRTAGYLGRGIKGLSHGLAPGVIVVGGQIASAWPMIEKTISEQLTGEYLVPDLSQPHIKAATAENPSFYGAFPLALRNVLQKKKRTA